MHRRPIGKLKAAVAAIYHRIPDQEELDKTGFCASDYEIDPVDLWPENEAAINLFSSISTQWRTGANGHTGLDYNVLFRLMDRMKLSDQSNAWLFDDIRVIEAEALNILHKKD